MSIRQVGMFNQSLKFTATRLIVGSLLKHPFADHNTIEKKVSLIEGRPVVRYTREDAFASHRLGAGTIGYT